MVPNPCPALCSAVVWVAVVLVFVWFLWPFVWVGWLFSIAAMNHYRTYPHRWFHAVEVLQSPFPNHLHRIYSSQTLYLLDCCCILDCRHRMNMQSYWQHCQYPEYSTNSDRYCMGSKWLQSMVQNLRWMKIYFFPNYRHRICHCKEQKVKKKKRKKERKQKKYYSVSRVLLRLWWSRTEN